MMDRETAKMFAERWREELRYYRIEYLNEMSFLKKHFKSEDEYPEKHRWLVKCLTDSIDDAKEHVERYVNIMHKPEGGMTAYEKLFQYEC